jgi:hypothetical protein
MGHALCQGTVSTVPKTPPYCFLKINQRGKAALKSESTTPEGR